MIAITCGLTTARRPVRMSSDKRIGFCGAGQMAEALARGFMNKGVVKAENIFCTDVNSDRKEVFKGLKCTPVDSNAEVS